ncbi:MAG: hypothetical protein J5884_04145 [Paludibacteraceae bacterium]|nr:hypothetical protein [Paludibacteraceae bacterium]
MKRFVLIMVAGLMSAAMAWAASGINYDGTSLALNDEFTRTECGTQKKSVMKEISGMACSRTTPGYLWAHGDENASSSDRKIIAIQPSGTLAMTVNLTTPDNTRDDWEDICTGVYGGKNYVFVGAIGDNDLAFNDQYYIFYFEEPAITLGSKTISVNIIRFGYPDNKAHNTETLMYDNVEQMFYIADKVEGVCHLYKLPFKTDYGSSVQQLTEVCALGNGSKFNLCTGGDITPDGKLMAIKNKSYVLLWERQGTESLSSTATRRPVQIAAYQKEEQGESLAWLNDSVFYTTSDSKDDTPIYKYTRGSSSGNTDPQDPSQEPEEPEQPEADGAVLYEIVMSNHYNAYIDTSEHTTPTVIHAFYLAGEPVPTVERCLVNKGTEWAQSGNTLTLTGQSATAVFALSIEAVQPLEFTTDEIVCDGSEGSWIKCPYGWDNTGKNKKWRFSKTDDDYTRELMGRTHVELFLPACDTVVLKSMSTERAVRVYVNGQQLGDKFTLKTSGNVLAVNQSAPFMLTVASAQSSGDGGIAAVRMARKSATDIDNIQSDDVECTKVMMDGQPYIIHNGTIYNVQGKRLR